MCLFTSSYRARSAGVRAGTQYLEIILRHQGGADDTLDQSEKELQDEGMDLPVEWWKLNDGDDQLSAEELRRREQRRLLMQEDYPYTFGRMLAAKVNVPDPLPEDLMEFKHHLLLRKYDLYRLSELARRAEEMFIRRMIAPRSVQEALLLRRREMLAEMGYVRAAQEERLVMERVVSCWLRFQIASYQYEAAILASTPGAPPAGRDLRAAITSIRGRASGGNGR